MDLEESSVAEEAAAGTANRGCQGKEDAGAAGRDNGVSALLLVMLPPGRTERTGRDMGKKLKPATGSPGWQNEPPLC